MGIDRKAILENNPKKRLIIGHDKLIKDYSEASALEYSYLYEDQSLSFVIENSSLIFSEPYYGYDFYKNIVAGPTEYGLFREYKNELDKVEEYIEEYGSQMGDVQKTMYESLKDALSDKISKFENTILVAEYTAESHDDNACITTVLDALYESSKKDIASDRLDELDNMISEAVIDFKDDKRYFIYGPIIAGKSMAISSIDSFVEAASNLTPEAITKESADFGDFMEDVFVVTQMMHDSGYRALLRDIPDRTTRTVFESFGKESPKRLLKELVTERVESIETYYTSPKDAVNMVLDNLTESALFEDDFNLVKNHNTELKKAAYSALSNLLLFEFQHVDDTNTPVGINLFKEGTSIETALGLTYHEIAVMNQILTETGDNLDDEDWDDDDEDFKNFEKKNNPNNDEDASKKVNAPKPKNLENAVQFKAMDAEAKQMKRMADRRQKGQGIKGAIKAVTNLPNNVISSIKQTIKQAENKRDDKRKDYMRAPGYRKKIFRNLKLAIMYGTAAQINLAFVPVTIFFRHFSKEKDRRLRNELVSELETEIKICDEKINDASGSGDNAEKYKLMRIKSQLERERIRVRTNSKYI